MKRIVAVFMALSFICLFAGASLAADMVLPAFKVKTADGKDFTNENIKDKKVMFVFSQMACRQCQLEMQDMNKKADELKGKAYVVLVDMNSEMGLGGYTKKGYKMDVLLDPEFKFPSSVGILTTPATIIVDGKGKVIFEKIGYNMGELDALLKDF